MQAEEKDRLHKLEAGQLWRIEHGYVYIVELGKRLIRYKMLRRSNTSGAPTQLIAVEALLNYLGQTEAELVSPDPASRMYRSGVSTTQLFATA